MTLQFKAPLKDPAYENKSNATSKLELKFWLDLNLRKWFHICKNCKLLLKKRLACQHVVAETIYVYFISRNTWKVWISEINYGFMSGSKTKLERRVELIDEVCTFRPTFLFQRPTLSSIRCSNRVAHTTTTFVMYVLIWWTIWKVLKGTWYIFNEN